MKKLITFIAIIVSIGANGQLTKHNTAQSKKVDVGEARYMNQFFAQMYYTVQAEDTTYTILYKNAKYQALTDIQAIVFDGADNTAGELYNLLLDILTNPEKPNEYKENITLGKTSAIITKFKSMKTPWIQIFTSDGYFSLNEKLLNKLFGKGK